MSSKIPKNKKAPGKLSKQMKNKRPVLEQPQESNPKTRRYGPYSSPGDGETFNIYTSDKKFRLTEYSQIGHVNLYEEMYKKRLAELEKDNEITEAIMTESLAHSLLMTAEHESKDLVTSLTDPTRHNPWSCAADRTKDNKRVTSISLRYIDLMNLNWGINHAIKQ